MNQTNDNNLLRDKEAGNLLGLSPATLNTWRCRGKGPKYVKLGGKVFYRRADLEDFISKNLVDPTFTAA